MDLNDNNESKRKGIGGAAASAFGMNRSGESDAIEDLPSMRYVYNNESERMLFTLHAIFTAGLDRDGTKGGLFKFIIVLARCRKEPLHCPLADYRTDKGIES